MGGFSSSNAKVWQAMADNQQKKPDPQPVGETTPVEDLKARRSTRRGAGLLSAERLDAASGIKDTLGSAPKL